jgi:hypothetical protein
VYDSPIPSSFLRCGASLSPLSELPPALKTKDKYNSHEYFVLVLTSQIAEGATGIVHGAILELETFDGQSLTQDVIVKLAFSDKQKERMRNEYAVYRHLTKANVSGIPQVLGLFEDLEGGPMALVMSNAGVSLWQQRADIAGQVHASTEERYVTNLYTYLHVRGKA